MSSAKRQGMKKSYSLLLQCKTKYTDSVMKKDRAVPSAEEAGELVLAMYAR